MKIAIVDDNLIFAQSFKNRFVNMYNDTIKALDIFTTAERFLESGYKYDVVFLDIDMPGMSGLELAKQYKDTMFSIVFVTNRDDLVFEAYNTTNTFGFVRKSNIEEDLPIVLLCNRWFSLEIIIVTDFISSIYIVFGLIKNKTRKEK